MHTAAPLPPRSIDIPPGMTLVTKADLHGKITYANEAFVDTSGYTLGELIGSAHHIVRHPDMPPAVFAEMWTALQSGKPWQGVLKNRCKNGEHYWVNACIVPSRQHEHITGYMAVLQHAEPAAIAAAQQRHQHLATHGLPAPSKLSALLGVRAGVRAGTAVVGLLMLAGGALGLGGLKLSDAAFARLYHEQFEPAAAVGQVEAQLSAIRARMLEMQLPRQSAAPAASGRQSIEAVQNAFDEIHEIFEGVSVPTHTTSSASQALALALQRYTREGRALINQAAAHHASSIAPTTQQQLLELENKASLSALALRQALMDNAHQEFTGTLQRNDRIRTLAIVGMVLGLLAIAYMGHLFIRSIVDPLNAAIRRLHRIAEGDLQSEVRLSGSGETAQLNHAAVVMQQHLKVMLDEIALASRRIHRHCQALNQSLHEVTEHSEAQHDQVHAAIRALNQAVQETADLSQRAERLMHMASSPDNASDVTTTLEHETRELATATRLTAFGADEVAGAMRHVAELIVENRSQAQLAWQASEELMRTANELNGLVDFFAPPRAQPPQALQQAQPSTIGG